MTSAVFDRTPNIKLGLIEFNFPNWADDANLNMKLIDAGIGRSGITIDGAWENSTAYLLGMLIVDSDENTLWRCAVAHTSAADPTTFIQDRTAHPGYWLSADTPLVPRGQWTNATVYYPNDVVYKDANKYSWAMAAKQFTSAGSYDADVAAGNLVIITDTTQLVIDATAAKNAAQTSATNSATSATNSQTSATSSANSATASQTSATNSATSATNSANSAAASLTSANNSAGSAAAALTSKTAAELAENNAELAEANAEAAEAAAEAALAQMLPDAPNDGLTYGRYNYTWRQVADTSLPEAPNDGRTYGRKSYTWVDVSTVVISDSTPPVPVVGQLWWKSNAGSMFIYYNDGNSSQWVPTHTGTGPQGPAGPVGGIPEAPMDSKSYARKMAAWAEVVGGGGSSAWADITGKPSTFPPSTHSHPQSEVTNLTTDLAGKAPTVHTHAQSDITGLSTSLTAKLDVSAYTAADVLTKIKTVDGAGSLLDSDLLDGQDGVYYRAWANLTGVPSTFTPSTHSHVIADTTGLQAALDAKSATGHTHAQAEITSLVTDLAAKEPTIATGTTAQFWRGDKTWQSIPASDWSTITGKPATFPPDVHTHAYSSLTSIPSTFAPSAHSHDYASITSKPATFPPDVHTHAYSSLTSIPSTFTPSVHTHVWADITDPPTTYAPSPHAHPQSEVTNLVTDLAAKAPLDVVTGGKITIGTVAPSSPATNDIWIDIN